jgi:hypothetical protein
LPKFIFVPTAKVTLRSGATSLTFPAISDEEAKVKFPKGWNAVEPYLRITPQPNK